MTPPTYRKAWAPSSGKPVPGCDPPTTMPASLMPHACALGPPSVPRSVSVPPLYRNARLLPDASVDSPTTWPPALTPWATLSPPYSVPMDCMAPSRQTKPRVASPTCAAPTTVPLRMAVAYAMEAPGAGRNVVVPARQTKARSWKPASSPMPTMLPSLPMPEAMKFSGRKVAVYNGPAHAGAQASNDNIRVNKKRRIDMAGSE